jgi:hypothetical protein
MSTTAIIEETVTGTENEPLTKKLRLADNSQVFLY